MPRKLWEVDSKTKTKSNLFEFEKYLAKNLIIHLIKIIKLFNWTIKNPKLFWSSIWEYANIKGLKNDKFFFSKRNYKK